ncbi:hypothetical protein CFOL_v3_28880 [Cephalotus follicularis]|uniref:RNase H type-1 domain-containing protein n=1 Tax=Cephalotus follicularis TaxID=3775 RepID=A0A1Q3CZ05_CEPFO|nr:hypothetical protein CFOL_v3_28880 [Cephalotus follicularis]
MSWICVKHQVIRGIQDLFASFNPKSHGFFLNQLSINSLNINQIPIDVQQGTWIKWQVPPLGTLKLYTDGSSINNLCAGGGVVRNHLGEIIIDFSSSFGTSNSVEAEAKSTPGPTPMHKERLIHLFHGTGFPLYCQLL